MNKGFAVLGLGKFGMSVAVNLAKAGAEVLAVDLDEEKVHDIADIVTYSIKADVCDAEALASLGIGNLDCAVVAIADNLEASVMATILVKEMGVPYVLTKAQNEIHAKILEKVGADNVVFPEKEMGARVARNLTTGNFIDLFELTSNVSMVEMAVKTEWIGKSLRELNLRDRYGTNVIAIKKGDNLDVTPTPDEALIAGETIIITGANNDLKKLV